jgi:hypothetical protein
VKTADIGLFSRICVIVTVSLLLVACSTIEVTPRRVGVVYVSHGGNDTASQRSSWESTLQIFSYDPNSAVYKNVIWNPQVWPQVLRFGNAPKEISKYAFEYARIGGTDRAQTLTLAHYTALQRELESRGRESGVEFIVEHAEWLSDEPLNLAYPRAIFSPGVPGGTPMRYCGSVGDGGTGPLNQWSGCDPDRYDVDGPIERLLNAGVSEIIMVDLTTSGVRFCKSFDVVNTARQVAAAFDRRNGTSTPVRWANDPNDLMTRSYPADQPVWTLALGAPREDRTVPLAGNPNPVAADPALALLHVEGIESRTAPGVDWADTGVLLINHATREHNTSFDPKIDDTLQLNANIKALLISRHPGLAPRNVVGGWFGRKVENPQASARPPAFERRERSREMRGENLGDAWLYETDVLPQGDMGYLYWDALDELRRNGVRHIVIAFPQIMVDSVLNLVEVPNQIGKELGYKSWLDFAQGDFVHYPEVGHPFADYWGMWVDTMCPVAPGSAEMVSCCFTMGGCADGRPYPPLRKTPVDKLRNDLDPSLAFEVSAFGHLGYDPAMGPPDPDQPVQSQYRGTWTLWQPPNEDPRIGALLASHVLDTLHSGPAGLPVQPVDFGVVRE